MPPHHVLRPATFADLDYITDLKERTMRPALERLGRWSPRRSRARVEAALAAGGVSIVEVDGAPVGSIAWTRDDDAWHLHLFYLEPARHGAGLGSELLRSGLAEHPGTVRIEVLRGTRSRSLYERFGFTLVRSDEVDDFFRLVRSS